MNMKPIIFRQGEENGIVIEREHFENSIMLSQYQLAVNIFHRLWVRQQTIIKNIKSNRGLEYGDGFDNQFSNVIAFCGDRGEGKSSCMTSFATILTNNNVRNATAINTSERCISFPKDTFGNDTFIPANKIEWLDMIDPSFFDKDHNILELLLGRISEKAQRRVNQVCENDCTIISQHRKLMEKMEEVKSCIMIMTPKSGKHLYDSVEDISELAAGMQLKTKIQELFRCFLDFVGKECLLICIDDLDMNVTNGFKMAEMLRKYLITPYCIILISVKVEQMIDIIANDYQKIMSQEITPASQCKEMAQKYVDKLLPRGNRVPMPTIEDICERNIQIAEKEKADEIDIDNLTVKERVVQLIFQKTGYVFYNAQYLSPIVPNNLRSLRHLIGTLESLPDSRNIDGSDNEIGREVFKDYFFNTWVKNNLDAKDFAFAKQVSEYTELTSFNAFIVEYVSSRVKSDPINIDIKKRENKKSASPEKSEESEIYDGDYAPLYNDIVDRTNTSSNISFGDVMYVLWLVSLLTIDAGMRNLIFFIRTVYSMRIYACYNEITSNNGKGLFPMIDHDNTPVNIHKADALYDNTNRLQRLINGSYFTYPRGAFLANSQDLLELDFNEIKKLFKYLKKEFKKDAGSQNKDYSSILKTCELLALCITFVGTKENLADHNFIRQSKIPTFLGTFSHSATRAYWDLLQPFYSVCNIKYAYSRFDEILSDNPTEYDNTIVPQQGLLYEIADSCEDSLLSKFKKIKTKQDGEKYDTWDLHGFVSDAIIRISDIQVAIFDELIRLYRRHKVGSSIEKMRLAYSDIQKLEITLYPTISIEHGRITEYNAKHHINFEFLNVLIDELNSYTKSNITSIEDLIKHLNQHAEKSNNKIIVINSSDDKEDVVKALNNIKFPIMGKKLTSKISASLVTGQGQKRTLTTNLNQIIKDIQYNDISEIENEIDNMTEAYTKVKK